MDMDRLEREGKALQITCQKRKEAYSQTEKLIVKLAEKTDKCARKVSRVIENHHRKLYEVVRECVSKINDFCEENNSISLKSL